MKKTNPSQKVVMVEEELDNIDIDDNLNLDDLPGLVFIDDECRNPKAFNWWWRAY